MKIFDFSEPPEVEKSSELNASPEQELQMLRERRTLDETPEAVAEYKRKWGMDDSKYSEVTTAIDVMKIVSLMEPYKEDIDRGSVSGVVEGELLTLLEGFEAQRLARLLTIMSYHTYKYIKNLKEQA